MKNTALLMYVLSLMLLACNSRSSKADSVAIADSTNQARRSWADSMGTYAPDSITADFLVDAANNGLAEISLGELAAQKAMHRQVKDIGAMLSDEHRRINEDLRSLAKQRNVDLPDSVGANRHDDIEKLLAKSGTAFDKTYLSNMIRIQERSIDLYQMEIDKGNDATVRTFAVNTLSRLQRQLDSLKAVRKQID